MFIFFKLQDSLVFPGHDSEHSHCVHVCKIRTTDKGRAGVSVDSE
jgi:hypothetical protein